MSEGARIPADAGAARLEGCRRGAAFLAEVGSEEDRFQAAALLGEGPVEPLLARCAAALAGAAPGTSPAVDAAWRWLARLADVRALHAPEVESLCRALEAGQASDGSWEPSPGPVSEEAVLDARIAITGLLAGQLARTPCVRPETLEGAADFLARHFTPDRLKHGAFWTLAACAQTFAHVPHDESDAILQWCGRELEHGYRRGVFDAVRTARVLLWCNAASLPGGRVSTGELTQPILRLQQPDGGWLDPADPGPAGRTQLTLDALAALARRG